MLEAKMIVARAIVALCICLVLPYSVQAQVKAQTYTISTVGTFVNKNSIGELFKAPNDPPDGYSGNTITFLPSGRMLVAQYDQRKLYELNEEFLVERIFPFDLPWSWGLVGSDNDGVYLSDGATGYGKYSLETGAIFTIKLNNLFSQFVAKNLSFMYHADILFFTDEEKQLHCVLQPSLDQTANKKNYRSPDQTKQLFAKGSTVDLQGLTMDERNRVFLYGKEHYWFGTEIQNYKYQVVDPDHVNLSDGKAGTLVSTRTNSDELGESTTIHPSGDIYFLRYSKVKNNHILYKIENTWDPEAKRAWEARKK